jgi:hypothetical protein
MHFVNVFRDNKIDRKFGAIKGKLSEINFSNEQCFCRCFLEIRLTLGVMLDVNKE